MQLSARTQQRHALWSAPASLPQRRPRCNRRIARCVASAAAGAAATSRVQRVNGLTWGCATSRAPSVGAAIEEACDALLRPDRPDDAPFEPTLALVFASVNYGSQLQDVVRALRREVPSLRHVFGCSAFGVLGSEAAGAGVTEVEGEPGLSLTLAQLPSVEVSVMHTLRSNIPSEDASPEAWSDLVGVTPLEALQPSRPGSAAASRGAADGAPGEGEAEAQDEAEPSSSSSSQSSSGGSGAGDAGSEAGAGAQAAAAAARLSRSAAPARDDAALSFLVLCDPCFQQSRQLLAGLDFAFPGCNKVGAVLSQGQANKKRLLYVWSADGSVQPGQPGWQRRQRLRRQAQRASALSRVGSPLGDQQGSAPQQQQQPHAGEAEPAPLRQPEEQAPQAQRSGPGKPGLLGSLFGGLLSSLGEQEQQQQPPPQQQQQPAVAGSAAAAASSSGQPQAAAPPAGAGAGAAVQQGGLLRGGLAGGPPGSLEPDDDSADAADEDDRAAAAGRGLFMYGGAVLALKGPLALEPVICQGYRIASDKVWTIAAASRDGDLIGSLLDPEPEAGEAGEGEAEVAPLLALYEVLGEAGLDPRDPSPQLVDELSSKLAVAVAADSWRPAEQLAPDDFQVAAISEVWQEGYIRIDGTARPGYRMRLVLRDEAGVRADLDAKLLALKRAELAGMMAGATKPPPLGTLLFTDIARGASLYEQPAAESSAVVSYLPAPLAGLFGAGQVCSSGGRAGLYEASAAIAVVRALPGAAPAPGQAQQQQEQREGAGGGGAGEQRAQEQGSPDERAAGQ